MLTNLTDDGQMTYHCGKCKGETDTHINHPDVQVALSPGAPLHHRTVQLPQCDCGARTHLKVDFTEEELAPPIITRGMLPTNPPREGIVQVEIPGSPNFTMVTSHLESYLDATGEKVVIRVIDGVSQAPWVQHHLNLAKQLETIGKATPPQ
jgi:hypothetical protein